MSNSYDKYLQLKEEGRLDYDPTNYKHVLEQAREIGLKTTILFDAMDIIRKSPGLTNGEAILRAASKWKLV